MPCARRKVEHITRLGDALFVGNCEEHPAALDKGDLFVRVTMRGSDYVRREAEATDHQVFTDNHLSLNARLELFDRNTAPLRVLWFLFFYGFQRKLFRYTI